MYFIITYDILTKAPLKISEARNFFKESLNGLPWVKPISNMYIVSCDSEVIRRGVFQRLINYSDTNRGAVRFLMTPLIDTGQITGVTAKELWPHIKRFTKADDGNNNPFI